MMSTTVVSVLRLSDRAVRSIVNAALDEAGTIGAPVAVGVVDTSGLLRAYVLMDGAPPIAQDVVVKKARTAAFTGMPTGGLETVLAAKLAAAATDFTDLHGGLPVVVDGVVVGGIAASGSTSENDAAVATAGLKAVDDLIDENLTHV